MKALFIRCYGKLTADMMIGGLIDMGVPPVYLKSKLKDAGLPDNFIEKPNPKAQISAHYFHIPPYGDKPLLLKQADLFRIWKDICTDYTGETQGNYYNSLHENIKTLCKYMKK